MTASSRRAAQECVSRLEADLAAAMERALSYDFDMPEEHSVQVVKDLIAVLAQVGTVHGLDVAVGVDGGVEITGRVRATNMTVEVSPTGSRIDAVLDTDGRVVWVGEETSAEELVKELERAA